MMNFYPEDSFRLFLRGFYLEYEATARTSTYLVMSAKQDRVGHILSGIRVFLRDLIFDLMCEADGSQTVLHKTYACAKRVTRTGNLTR